MARKGKGEQILFFGTGTGCATSSVGWVGTVTTTPPPSTPGYMLFQKDEIWLTGDRRWAEYLTTEDISFLGDGLGLPMRVEVYYIKKI